MSAFFAITVIIILAAISPGPDFAVVSKNALLYSRKSGIFTALGIFTSLLIHSSYCIFGLAIVITKSLLLFSLIKYAGAAYLIYIGIKGLLARKNATAKQAHHAVVTLTDFQSFRQGLLCNLLNPKAIMFLLAFFTLIITPSTTLLVQIGYALEIMLIHFIWFSWLSVMVTHPRVKTRINKIQHYIVKVMGVVLIGFGLHIATLHQKMN